MATIALYNRPEMLRSGDRTLQPAQFRLADSGMAQALGGIAQMTSKLAVSLNEKSKAATSANSLIELESDIAADELQRTKWFQMNQSDNQIEKDGINTWEQKATTDVDALMAKWDSRSAGLDQETQIRIKQRLNNYKSNSVAGAWGSSLKQKGQNFGANFNAMMDLVAQNGDSRAAEQVLDVAGKSGLFSAEQTQAYNTKLQLAKDNFVLTQANTQIQNLLDSAKVYPANFDTAKAVTESLYKQGKIQYISYKSMIDNIDLKARYNFNLEQAKNDIKKDATQVLNDIKDTTSAKPVVSPAGFSGEISGPATVWGMNLDGTPDPQDKGDTAWESVTGLRTDNKITRGVSLPFATLEKMFGRDYHNYIAEQWKKGTPVMIEVTNPNTGATVVAPIIDKGPAASTGNAIDLTYAVATELGSKGKDVMTFKLAGGEPGKGKYQWAGSQDLEELQIQAGKQVTAEATNAFATIKQNIDLNKIVATVDLKKQFPGSITIDEALKNTYYKALNYANDPHIQVMRDTLYAYADKAKNEQTKDDPVVYDKTILKIDEYDATKDPYGSQAASLEAFINAKFNQERQSQLKDRLNSHRDNALTYKANKVAAPAISLLNKSAYDDQLLGSFREMHMVEIIDKDRKVSNLDVEANTLLMLPKRDASGAIVNDESGAPIMERRVPVKADVDANMMTGTKRWVMPRSATSVSYLQYKGPDELPELVTVKKDKLSDAQIVYKENSEQKAIVTDHVKNIRDTIEEDIKTGRITDSEQAIKKVKAMIQDRVNIKVPGASTPDGTPALPPANEEDTVKKAREKAAKLLQQR